MALPVAAAPLAVAVPWGAGATGAPGAAGALGARELAPDVLPLPKIAEAILKMHKNVRTVLRKMGAMEGVFRVRKMQHVAGEKRTTTLYTEHGVKMMLDVSKVYFSVRLSNERKRIASQVKKGEKILALFAGVGPFPLVISKKHPDTEIVAIEQFPECYYDSLEDLIDKMKSVIRREVLPPKDDLMHHVARFDWHEMAGVYDEALEGLLKIK